MCSFISVIALVILAIVFGPKMELRDALLKLSRLLPASTSAVKSGSIDTSKSTAQGKQLMTVEFLLSAPAVTTSQLPDAKLFQFDILHSDNADLSSSSVLYSALITQTGAGGVGAVAATARMRIPTNAKRYIGFQVTPSASGTGDASAAIATLEALF